MCYVVTDSPCAERMERKDSIRRFLREQFRDDKKSKENKENKENKDNAVVTATAGASSSAQIDTAAKSSHTETKTKSSAYRLFRTVRIRNIFTDEKTSFFIFNFFIVFDPLISFHIRERSHHCRVDYVSIVSILI